MYLTKISCINYEVAVKITKVPSLSNAFCCKLCKYTMMYCLLNKETFQTFFATRLSMVFAIMVIRVVKFSSGGYKIRKIFYLRINIPKGNYWTLSFGLMASCQKVPKFDFQSQLSMSKMIKIFFNFFFIEGYQFRSTLFVIDIFW